MVLLIDIKIEEERTNAKSKAKRYITNSVNGSVNGGMTNIYQIA